MWPALRAKILAIKACRWRCLSYASGDKALMVARPVLVMLMNLLEGNGTFAKEPEKCVCKLFVSREAGELKEEERREGGDQHRGSAHTEFD